MAKPVNNSSNFWSKISTHYKQVSNSVHDSEERFCTHIQAKPQKKKKWIGHNTWEKERIKKKREKKMNIAAFRKPNFKNKTFIYGYFFEKCITFFLFLSLKLAVPHNSWNCGRSFNRDTCFLKMLLQSKIVLDLEVLEMWKNKEELWDWSEPASWLMCTYSAQK